MDRVRTADVSSERLSLGAAGARWAKVSALLGVAGLAAAAGLAALGEDGATRFLRSYLVSYAFFLSLALGALGFVMIHHVTRAGWSVVLRRVGESVAAGVVPLAVLAVPILLGLRRLYPWADPGHVAGDAVLAGKQVYLNVPFFVIRVVLYFAAWGALAAYLLGRSREQDRSGDPALTRRMERASCVGIFVYALTLTFAAFDLLMSLDPHWSSTIFGVYYFAGGLVGFFALLPLSMFALERARRLCGTVTQEHYQDMGKLVFAFVVFWAYIAFSQYFLIWYTNVSEETAWYHRRQAGSWGTVSVALLLGHFVLPFLLLLSRGLKRQPPLLVACAVWVLVMHWLDLYWLVVPETSPGRVPIGLVDLACVLGMGGLLAAASLRWLGAGPLVPFRDPRLAESLEFENA